MQVIAVIEDDVVQNIDATYISPFYRKGKQGKVSNWGPVAHTKQLKKKLPVHELVYWRWLEHLYEAARLIVNSRQKDLELAFQYIKMTLRDNPEIHHLSSHAQDLIASLDQSWATEKDNVYRFQQLIQALLAKSAEYGKLFRGIVFVQQRLSTHILKDYIAHDAELASIFDSGCIYATNTPATASFKITNSQSKHALSQFGNGEINLLISTAVSEEGLDVPAANVVIRFDPIQTPVSLVQSKGRARQSQSSFVVLSNQSEKRSFAVMEQARQHQMDLLATHSFTSTTEAIARREKAQQSRMRSALMFLGKSKCGPSLSVLNTFVTKDGGEVQTDIRKVSKCWKCCMNILLPGESIISSNKMNLVKKQAKSEAATALLQILIKKYTI